uniref:Uncharacterized protein n=1 Tax=Raoultella planticola TaxID=575 RepID=W8CUE9_RAOPL|nr:hypothetical protein pKpNDM1_00102 [Raoultella planticola]QZX60302.1 hypothetical protein [Klebsiella michiganensis]UMW96731.1 hypothetical protein [Raoultella ornithinolytica]UWX38308.1 hypothetical protein KJK04_p1520 [Klebsiella quasipneumoniae]
MAFQGHFVIGGGLSSLLAVPKYYHQHYQAEIQHTLTFFYHINK